MIPGVRTPANPPKFLYSHDPLQRIPEPAGGAAPLGKYESNWNKMMFVERTSGPATARVKTYQPRTLGVVVKLKANQQYMSLISAHIGGYARDEHMADDNMLRSTVIANAISRGGTITNPVI